MEKKVLFISHTAGRTGAPLMLLNFLKWMRKNSPLPFEILLLDDGPLRSEFAALGSVHILLSEHTEADTERLLAQLRENGIGLIYANSIASGKVLETLSPLHCPAITHVHELNYWIGRSGKKNMAQTTKHTTRYIAASNAVKNNLVTNYDLLAETIDVVHSFIPVTGITANPTGIRQTFGIPEDAFVILGSGHETWRKGKDIFILLAAQLHRTTSPDQQLHFLWVGGWQDQEDHRNIIHDVNRLGLDGIIHFTGEVINPLDYFAAGNVFAMVSREDPFPLVCLEAAALSKPVLCFESSGGMPEFVEEDAGFSVPYLDLESMAEKIVSLAGDPDLNARLGEHAAEKVRRLYNVPTGSGEIVQIIENELTTVYVPPSISDADCEDQAHDETNPPEEPPGSYFWTTGDQLKAAEDQLRKNITEFKINIAQHKKHIENIENSLSWKITAPLRRVVGILNGENSRKENK